MPIWLLTGLVGLRKALAAVFGVVVAYPWQAACIALLLFGAWEWRGWDKTEAKLEKCDAGRKADQAQWEAQVKAANAATAKAKQDGKDASNDAETYHTELQAANGNLRQYIADHRVPAARPPVAAGPGSRDDPAVSPEAPAVPTVAVPESVVNTCDADYTYAASAFKLGQELVAKGLAVPQ